MTRPLVGSVTRATKAQFAQRFVDDPVVVVTAAEFDLFVGALMRAPMAVGLRKSNGVPVHRFEFAGRNQALSTGVVLSALM
jgi:hypothetical protein